MLEAGKLSFSKGGSLKHPGRKAEERARGTTLRDQEEDGTGQGNSLLDGLKVALGGGHMQGRGAGPGVVDVRGHALRQPETSVVHDQLFLRPLGCVQVHS